MNNFPKITIITPSFNHKEYIERTIHSVLSQNYPNLEYIIMDGGSTDGTLEILKKYSSQLIWISERDRGLYHAINKGLAMATGEIIGYLNSDDTYESGTLLKVGHFFSDNPNEHWLAGKCKIVDVHDKEINRPITAYRNFLLRFLNSYSTLLVVDYIPQPSTFWRKQLTDTIGQFNEEYKCVSDYDYWLRAMKIFRLRVVNDYLSCFRTQLSSKTQTRALSDDQEEAEMIKGYMTSRLIGQLYKLHRFAIVSIYKLMAKQPN